MVTDMITLKLEESFLTEIDSIVSKEGFQNRTEFIRNAVRDKIKEIKYKNAMIEFSKLKGESKIKTKNKEYEKIRKKSFNDISKSLK